MPSLRVAALVLLYVVHVAADDEWLDPEERDPETFDDGHDLRMSMHTRGASHCGVGSLFHK